ncbi:MAG: DUF4199 domain-containing protein [Sediminicola sp.]|tara:strand:+ start:56286 stop:56807 length:522 start_codon:yes stop_codon:yes gene_type:complete
MEDNKPTTGKFALNYGLILGALGIVFSLMLFSLDMHYQGGMVVIGTSIVMFLAIIVWALLQFRKANNGLMSFGQGLKIGVGISLVAGIIGTIMNQVMEHVIDPDMVVKAMDYQKAMMLEKGMTAEAINNQMKMAEPFQTPLMKILFGLLFSIIFGFLLTLIPALVLKKKETNE